MASPGLPTIRLEVNLIGPYAGDFFTIGDPDRGKLDNFGFASSLIWADLSDRIRSWSFSRGASQGNSPVRRYDPGTLTVVMNDGDRALDPDNLSGPYADGTETQLVPMVRVRLIAEWAGVAYSLYTGFADDWRPDYQGNDWTYTTLTATDGMKILTSDDRQAAAAGFAGELSGARVSRILNSLSWPVADRLTDPGASTLQATTLEGPALNELQLVQDTEMGDLFIDGRGRVVFQDRRAPNNRAASKVSQASFGDGGYAITGEIPYADTVRTGLDDNLINRVTVTRAGGTEQLSEDLTSQDRYLVKSFSGGNDLIMQTDAEAKAYADVMIYRYANPIRRYEKITFNTPAIDVEDVTWPQLLGREFGDRITITRRPSGGGDPIIGDCFIRGVEMSSDGESWVTSWTLQSAEAFSYFTFGDPVRGRLDAYPFVF